MRNFKNRLVICLTFIYLFSDLIFSQEPQTLWTEVLGGDSDDVAYDIEELNDGGYAVVGYTKSIPLTNFDVWF
ncbi:MAG: hypothetical protein IPH11_12890 [Ignavibacteriales bacterium]|nr:hypothetical protein [Ignavibacteriales bacterium]